jgi:hypothetical protein
VGGTVQTNTLGNSEPDRDGGVWTAFVGLYLVLFAMFILLVSMSKPDLPKTAAVVESVRTRFASGTEHLEQGDGLFVAGTAALAELGGDLAGQIRVAQVTPSARGDRLFVVVPLSGLYAADSAELGESAAALIDRIIAAFVAPPPGLALDLTFTLFVPADAATTANRDQDLALATRRAGVFARTLVARGAPGAAIAVGVGPGTPDRAVVAFSYRAIERVEAPPTTRPEDQPQ